MTKKKVIEKDKRFWLIARDPTTVAYHNPTHAYPSAATARAAAAKLAADTGHRFYVLETIAYCDRPAVVAWTEL